MNPTEDQLNRLLKAASRAPRTETRAAMFALETRVIAGWRASSQAESGEMLVALCRRAAVFACCLALASLAWNYHALARQSGDELAAAESSMRIGINP
jgi:hypothetical protein